MQEWVRTRREKKKETRGHYRSDASRGFQDLPANSFDPIFNANTVT